MTKKYLTSEIPINSIVLYCQQYTSRIILAKILNYTSEGVIVQSLEWNSLNWIPMFKLYTY